MIEEPRFVLRNLKLRKARARAARHQPNVVGDFVERNRQRAQRPGKLYQSVMRALHCEFIRRAHEQQASELGDLGRSRLAEAGCRVDTGAHRRAAQRQTVDSFQRIFDPVKIVR